MRRRSTTRPCSPTAGPVSRWNSSRCRPSPTGWASWRTECRIDEIGRRGLSLLTALEAVHALGLVHRDLKPENVFSADLPPVTRIFDFGLVKPPAGTPQQDTTVGTFMGTPEYMAPEQLDSSAPVDLRADIYAIGAIFYEMLAGRPPFWGNAAEVQQALANRRAPRPSRYVAGAPARARGRDSPLPGQGSGAPVRVDRRAGGGASRRRCRSRTSRAGRAARRSRPPAPADAKAAAAATRHAGRWPSLAVHGIGVDALIRRWRSVGGHLAEVGRGGGVGLFTDKTSENPVARAIRWRMVCWRARRAAASSSTWRRSRCARSPTAVTAT